MITRVQAGKKRDRYMELIRRFPLRPIRSDEELREATAVVDSLLDQAALNRDEQDYLDVLGGQIERYESEHVKIKPVSDVALLRHLIEAKGTTQSDVAFGTGIAESTISAVLAGRRKLTRKHIARIARYFGVEPVVFSFVD